MSEVNSTNLRQRLAKKSAGASNGNPLDKGLKVFTPPEFTIKQMLDVIPAHCYERSTFRSMLYVIQDFASYAAFIYLATFIDPSFGANGAILDGHLGVAAKYAAWCLFWAFASFALVGVWILGHECGHQAFSANKTVNWVAGLFLHSFVLMPFHAWRISHGKHHAATGHLTRDEVFVPATRSYVEKNYRFKSQKVFYEGLGREIDQLLEDAPLYNLFWLFVQQLFGFPAYLLINASGQDWYPKWTNHYMPSSKIFNERQRNYILISDAFIVAMLSGIAWVAHTFGFATMMKYYGIPYILVNHWLVMLTYLQHTDPLLPHYRAGKWTFARGALCTIDRNMFGFVGPYMMHGITETHVAHHTSSMIPHYHAWEATECLKKLLGEHYVSTDENMFVSLWKNWKCCRFVDDDADTVMYRDAYGIAQRVVAEEHVASDSGIDVLDSADVSEDE